MQRHPSLYFSAWLCVAVLAGACAALPTPTPVPAPVGLAQNAPATPALATTQVETTFDSPLGKAAAPDPDCPGLDSMLRQIVGSPDPLGQAGQLQLKVQDNKILVVLLLAQQDASFLRAYDVEIGSQADLRVQAFVPPDRLCELTRSGKVLSIRVPGQAGLQ